jgi:hypothetical protein
MLGSAAKSRGHEEGEDLRGFHRAKPASSQKGSLKPHEVSVKIIVLRSATNELRVALTLFDHLIEGASFFPSEAEAKMFHVGKYPSTVET